ncbi:MAG: potassium channel family protein [Paludibaculum sp.]
MDEGFFEEQVGKRLDRFLDRVVRRKIWIYAAPVVFIASYFGNNNISDGQSADPVWGTGLAGLGLLAWYLNIIRHRLIDPPPREQRGVSTWYMALFVYLMWLFMFASFYWSLGTPGFGKPLTRVDALYLSTTIATTTGFGDFAPTSQAARAVVIGQMLTGSVLVALTLAALGTTYAGARRHTARPTSEALWQVVTRDATTCGFAVTGRVHVKLPVSGPETRIRRPSRRATRSLITASGTGGASAIAMPRASAQRLRQR